MTRTVSNSHKYTSADSKQNINNSLRFSFEISGGYVTMTIMADEYLEKLVDMAHIQTSCMVQVTETNQYHCQTGDFLLLKPHLNIQVPDTLR